MPEDLAQAEEAAQRCDLLLAVGSTLSVYPVAGLVPLAKKEWSQKIVVVNGEPTAMDSLADAVLYGGIGKPAAIIDRLNPKRSFRSVVP
ncbi:MAG: hypothetical protein CM1200mP41_12560 [Gammaproteobacteria bacterium]|nr:MAG: hypothetical protein CM1200mP41_12560 [Gammaproteobacteria bacterium]